VVMQEELQQFEINDVWEFVPRPKDVNVIRTKWVFHNKIDEFGSITKNNVRLVAQSYTQVESIDFNETFTPVVRLKFFRLLLTVACAKNFALQQIDVKSTFLK
jgi:hypothetical protein